MLVIISYSNLLFFKKPNGKQESHRNAINFKNCFNVLFKTIVLFRSVLFLEKTLDSAILKLELKS